MIHGCRELRIVVIAAVSFVLFLLQSGCSINKVETSKALYEQARQAQAKGNDLEAVLYWKSLLQQSEKEMKAGKYVTTNQFLHASAYFELGQWDRGFPELKQLEPDQLRSEELWIYPLYLILLGDYYSQNQMPSVAEHFYESILKKSSFKTSSVYLLALERKINNRIKFVAFQAEKEKDPEKFKRKEYETLAKEVEKYLEEFPFSSVPHFLLADLLLKTGYSDEALEHCIAALELNLPTADLRQSAEFEIATLLSDYPVSPRLKSVLLKRASEWWENPDHGSIFQAGENNAEWISQQLGRDLQELKLDPGAKVRYLALSREGKLKILIWE